MAIDKKISATIVRAAEEMFQPTAEQKKAKSAFYAVFNSNPICVPDDIEVDLAVQFTGMKFVRTWWKDPQFVIWFKNQNEFMQKLEYLASRGLDILEDIIEIGEDDGSELDPMQKEMLKARTAGTKLKAIELIMKATGKIQKDTGGGVTERHYELLVEAALKQMAVKKPEEIAGGDLCDKK